MTATVPILKNEAPIVKNDFRGGQRKSSFTSLLGKLIVLALMITAGAYTWPMLFEARSASDDLAFLPEQTNAIVRVDVARFITSPFAQELRPLVEARIGESLESEQIPKELLTDLVLDIETVTLGMSIADPKKPNDADVAGVVRFRSEQLLDNLISARMAAEASYEELEDGKTIVTIDGGALCQFDAHTLAIGKPSTLRDILGRDGKPASLSAELQEAYNAADLSHVLTVVAAMPAPSGEAQPSGLFMPDLSVLKSFVIDADADQDLRLGAQLFMATEAAAQQWSQMLNMFVMSAKRRDKSGVAMPDDLFEASTSGATISIAINLPQDFVREGLEAQQRHKQQQSATRTIDHHDHDHQRHDRDQGDHSVARIEASSADKSPPTRAGGRRASDTCRQNMAKLNYALERYFFESGTWPASIDELAAHAKRDLARSCALHGADYAIDPKTHRIIERSAAGASRQAWRNIDGTGAAGASRQGWRDLGAARPATKRDHGAAVCRQNAAELNALIERYYFDTGKFPAKIAQLAKPNASVSTFCQTHNTQYEIDPKTHRVIEHDATVPQSVTAIASVDADSKQVAAARKPETPAPVAAKAPSPVAPETSAPVAQVATREPSRQLACQDLLVALQRAADYYYFEQGRRPASLQEAAQFSQKDLQISCPIHGSHYEIDPASGLVTGCQQVIATDQLAADEPDTPVNLPLPSAARPARPAVAEQLPADAIVPAESQAATEGSSGVATLAVEQIDASPVAASQTESEPRDADQLQNSAEAQRVLADGLAVAGYAGEYLIYSAAERDDMYTFAVLLPPLYFGQDSPLLIGVQKASPHALTAYELTAGNGASGWATQGRQVFDILKPRQKISIRESYATPEELFNAFKASATEGDLERYAQVFAGRAKKIHATRERMEVLGQAFPGINYQGFEPLADYGIPSLLAANGRDRIATSELEFGYLLVGEDGGTVQRLSAAKLGNGWRVTQN